MTEKIDYLIAVLVGFLTGVFAIPVVYNLGIREPAVLMVLPLAVPMAFAFGVWFGRFLSRWISVMPQFSRFAAVGFLNTSIDFGILNLFSLITGVTAGFVVGGINIPGFTVAALNSYFWNKFWVFKKVDERGVFHDLPKFAVVTIAGLLINSGMVILMTTYIPHFFGIGGGAWLNLAKIMATIIVLFWNFLGYKFVVFGEKKV